MKKLFCLPLILVFLASACPRAHADTIVFQNGRTMTGTIVRTNAVDILLMTEYAAFNFPQATIKDVQVEKTRAREYHGTDRLPPFRSLLPVLAKQAWASDLRAIPATVVDKGALRNVPYMSFTCGDDYEVNIYGDPDHPAGVEVGVYRKLLSNASVKGNCLAFMEGLLTKLGDRETVRGLNMEKDLKSVDELIFEVTPPSAEDAYMGWWISVYSERALGLARASDKEMKQISLPRAEAEKQAEAGDPTSWSAKDLSLSRQPYPSTISFTTKSGMAVTDAQVVRVSDGASLVWRQGASGGVVRLADLPEDLRVKFGYDPAKTAAADAADAARKERERQQAQAYAAQAAAVAAASRSYDTASYSDSSIPYSRSYGSPSLSTGGSVYVHGYTRSNGTYVHSYTRRR